MPQRFVYYRVRPEDVQRVQAAVAALQSEVATRWPGLHGRLMRRAEDRPAATGDVTLMEIYEGLPSAEAAADVERQANLRLATWLVGQRHVEDFEPCA